MISSSSSDEENTELTYNDNSDGNLDKRIEIKLGDYVVVLVAGKSRSLKYIARIDDYDEDDCEYEGVFLQKVNRKIKSGMDGKGLTFVVNEEDGASFASDDIVQILPAPIVVGGSERRNNQVRFDIDLSKLDLA